MISEKTLKIVERALKRDDLEDRWKYFSRYFRPQNEFERLLWKRFNEYIVAHGDVSFKTDVLHDFKSLANDPDRWMFWTIYKRGTYLFSTARWMYEAYRIGDLPSGEIFRLSRKNEEELHLEFVGCSASDAQRIFEESQQPAEQSSGEYH